MRLLALACLTIGVTLVSGLAFGGSTVAAHNNPNQPCIRPATQVTVFAKAGQRAIVVVASWGYFYKTGAYSSEPLETITIDGGASVAFPYTAPVNRSETQHLQDGFLILGQKLGKDLLTQNVDKLYKTHSVWLLRAKSSLSMVAGTHHTATVTFAFRHDNFSDLNDGVCKTPSGNIPEANSEHFVVRP